MLSDFFKELKASKFRGLALAGEAVILFERSRAKR
jgi:hypothetical protein